MVFDLICQVSVKHKEYDLFISGEPKSLIKFYIHPDSVDEALWTTDFESGFSVLHSIKNPIPKKSIQMDMDMLLSDSLSPCSVLSRVLPEVVSDSHHEIAESIITRSRQIIAENAINKAVEFVLKINIYGVTSIEKEEVMESLSRSVVDDKYSGEESCAICLDEFLSGSTAILLRCSHQFHEKCITKCFDKSFCCPLCRSDMATALIESMLTEEYYLK